MKLLVTDDDRLFSRLFSAEAFAECVCDSALSALRTIVTDFKDAPQTQYNTYMQLLFVTAKTVVKTYGLQALRNTPVYLSERK